MKNDDPTIPFYIGHVDHDKIVNKTEE